ncbi:MAG: iron hydrogenase small subunit [Desulfobacterales bacterium]
MRLRSKRQEGLYAIDWECPVRQSHNNPMQCSSLAARSPGKAAIQVPPSAVYLLQRPKTDGAPYHEGNLAGNRGAGLNEECHGSGCLR